MATGITPIEMRIIDPHDGLILRFKNDLGGRDLIHFPGNYALFVENETLTTVELNIENFNIDSPERSRDSVLKLRTQDKIQCSRFIDIENKDVVKQLISSRFVELYTGQKNDSESNQINAWVQVKIRLRDWNERSKENQIFVAIEIIPPERYTDEA